MVVLTGCDDSLDIPYYASCIYVINTDGSNLKILPIHPGYKFKFIPNTTKILYTDKDSSLCTINYETHEIDTLVIDNVEYPQPSMDGTIAIFKKQIRDCSEIFKCNIDGTDIEQLTNLPGSTKDYYSFSFDSEKIVFVVEKEESKTTYSLCMLDLLSQELTTLLTTEKRLSFPIFSPDGEKIYYIRVYSDTYNFARLHVMNIDGTHLHQFNDDYVLWNGPLYITADGEKIVYDSWDSLRVVNTDDSENIGITKCINYALSKSGNDIVYIQGSSGYNTIYLINLDGSGNSKIFSDLASTYTIFLHSDEKLAFTGKHELNKESKNYITN